MTINEPIDPNVAAPAPDVNTAPTPPPPLAREGKSHDLGTVVFVHGITAPDAPPSFGTVVGYERAASLGAEQRHVVAMRDGGEWTCDFVDLEVLTPARQQELVDAAVAARKAIADRRAVESKRA